MRRIFLMGFTTFILAGCFGPSLQESTQDIYLSHYLALYPQTYSNNQSGFPSALNKGNWPHNSFGRTTSSFNMAKQTTLKLPSEMSSSFPKSKILF